MSTRRVSVRPERPLALECGLAVFPPFRPSSSRCLTRPSAIAWEPIVEIDRVQGFRLHSLPLLLAGTSTRVSMLSTSSCASLTALTESSSNSIVSLDDAAGKKADDTPANGMKSLAVSVTIECHRLRSRCLSFCAVCYLQYGVNQIDTESLCPSIITATSDSLSGRNGRHYRQSNSGEGCGRFPHSGESLRWRP